jgi:uncharacterized protein
MRQSSGLRPSAYAGTGVAIAFIAGWVLGMLKMERHPEPWVMTIAYNTQASAEPAMAFSDRLDTAVQGVRDIVGKVWPYLFPRQGGRFQGDS